MGRQPKNPDAPYWRQLRKAECEILEFALANAETISHAAAALGISTTLLNKKIRELDIEVPKPKTQKNAKTDADKTIEEIEAAHLKAAEAAANAKLRELKEHKKTAAKQKRTQRRQNTQGDKPSNVIPLKASADDINDEELELGDEIWEEEEEDGDDDAGVSNNSEPDDAS